MQRWLQDPRRDPMPGVFRDLAYGWGNRGWSAQDDLLLACLREITPTVGAVLECGSGLSTILLGARAEAHGVRVWSLEHEEGWATKVQQSLDHFGIRSVTLLCRKLVSSAEWAWYDVSSDELPSFRLVCCDGPPGDTFGGRLGMVPTLRANLARGCVIFLDDTHRPAEATCARAWAATLDATIAEFGTEHRFTRIEAPA
jgi:hypothetical protein